jgi:hypothetical protein
MMRIEAYPAYSLSSLRTNGDAVDVCAFGRAVLHFQLCAVFPALQGKTAHEKSKVPCCRRQIARQASYSATLSIRLLAEFELD